MGRMFLPIFPLNSFVSNVCVIYAYKNMSSRIITYTKKQSSAGDSTPYQLHKSQHDKFSGIMHKIIDYSEYRLKDYISTVTDPQQNSVLTNLLDKYVKGLIAISWRNGLPLWINVTKDN